MAFQASKTPTYPSPLIFPPSHAHKQTLIVLHGRGSSARKFAEPLLTCPVSTQEKPTAALPSSPPAASLMTFRDHFPNAKFVFPTAPLRRAVKFNRSLTRQWFDNWSLVEPELKQHLQVRGLRETATFLRELLREEIAVVGPENVALMGLSQGCAASLVTSLLWEGETFGALVGMCGYLPFRKGMLDFVEEPETEDQDPLAGSGEEDDLFERDEEGSEAAKSNLEKAIVWLREELDVPETGDESSPPIVSIPIFMGHGIKDEKVPLKFGRLAVEFLRGLGPNVQWNEYEELGHWYSEDMLRDVVQFLRALKGWGDMTNESSV